ncbi:MAG: metallophosphoesterase, partial [Nanoarchaeota archaeon]|nr:metallophosphoesterase [Nanoarchaeota archaeon]
LVFGNNDADIYNHMKACPENVRLLGRFYIDHVDGKIIALIHGDIEGSAEALFKSGDYDIVIRGHSHVAEVRKKDGRLLLNPGSLVSPLNDFPRWTPSSVAILDTVAVDAKIVKL